MFIADNYEYSPDCNENATIVQIQDDFYKIHFAIASSEGYDLYNCTKLCYSAWDKENNTWGEAESYPRAHCIELYGVADSIAIINNCTFKNNYNCENFFHNYCE